MKFLKHLAIIALLSAPVPALGQAVPLQGGPWVGGHVPMYAGTGNAQPVIQDAGGASGGAISTTIGEMGLTVRGTGTAPYADAGTGPNAENWCDYDAPTSNATGYHVLCLSPNAQGGGLISYGTGGGAAPLPLQFLINGEIQSFASTSGYVAGDVLCFSTVSEAIVPCPSQPGTMYSQNSNAVSITGGTISSTSLTGNTITGGTIASLGTPISVNDGGTGVTSYSALRTALGLGTMALQNASAVAITGGTITGMPSPSATTDVANKAYVDSVATGLIPLAASTYVTVAALPTNTYSNGASGVGATLTATANAALSVDATAVSAGNTIIVNNEVTTSHNGIYTVTATGDGSNPYVLTRATYFDTAAEMLKNSYSAVTSGATQAGTSWILSANVTTVGTTSVSFTLFGASSLTLANGTIYVGNATNIATSRTMSGDGTLSNTGVITVTKTNGTSFAASATTDTTVATNITSGTLPAARLPNPSASTLGGVQSYAAVSNQFLTSISTAGVPASAQPAFTNISGTATAAQGGTGQASYTNGDMLYASGATTLSKVGVGSSGQVLTVSGGFPVWSTPASASSSVVLNTQSGNYTLLTSDNSKLLQFTGSGDATWAFTAAATLGNGWFTYLQNKGTSNATVTLDPNGGETIDGISSFKMYPNEIRLVQTNGTSFTSVVLHPFGMTLTSTITFTVPPGYTGARGMAWGGGGGGGSTANGSAGGGGAGGPFDILMSSLTSPGSTVSFAVGTGGGTNTAGGNTSLGSAITFYGGGLGGGTNSGSGGGGGGLAAKGGDGGTLTSSAGGDGGAAVGTQGGGAGGPTRPSPGSIGTLFGGGGGGGTNTGTNSDVSGGAGNGYGGGGGAGSGASGSTAQHAGGASVWGGGGGGAGVGSAPGGASTYGGAGGAYASNGTAPGGGGGGTASGARGEIRVSGY